MSSTTQHEASGAHTSLAALAARHDRSHMQTVIDNFPGQIEAALTQALPPIHVPSDGYRKVVIVGMGGSALPADVMRAAFQDVLTVDIEVVRHYVLPATIDERCLVIVSSFSGSTEETLEALDALPRDARNVAVVTAGGALQAQATERGYPLVLIPVEREPPGFQPRSATGYFLTYFARILAAAGLVADPTGALSRAAAFVRSLRLQDDAEHLARWLGSRIPVVYTDEQYMLSVARIAKIKFNENSKRPAFFNALPEANHNEMIGFVKDLGQFAVVYIHNDGSHPRVLRRFEVMEKVFKEDGLHHVDFYRWTMPGSNRLENVLATLAFIEQCSYYLALLDGFDPTPVDLVQKFKREMVK